MKWLKKWIEKRRWKLKLERMDFIWYFYGGILNELEAMVLGYKKKLEESKEG